MEALGAVRPRTLLAGLEIAFAVALAAQAARLAWALVTPVGPFGAAATVQSAARPQADLSILARFDPFFRVSGAAAGPAASGGDASQLVLHGVRAAAGGRGSAILSISGIQRSVTVGEEVEPDVVLAAVGADHVILSRGGARRRLGFPTPQPGAAVEPATASLAPAEAAQPSSGAAIDPRRLLAQTSLVPRVRDGQAAGYTVYPKGGSDVLRQAGLQQGDVLLAVDGVTLTPERVSQLQDELAGASGAEIRFERGGQVMNTRIRTAAQ
ncbi:type II secretion system protein N [Phenylobacterium sp.]|uniref:type II secretion system protein N n=1 Tax=Phenylobacterium sp. TaxID=1871053 RepID=UPI002C811C06|nr:type II secretion system protein N [Phenylobacterium sp.]HVI34467.1 type II secretion system protein N [Phenylobacterium sp.]